MRRQQGFGIVEVILIAVTIVVMAGVGFLAYKNFSASGAHDDGYQTAGTDSMNHDVKTESIEQTADLDAAAASIDDSSFENDGTTNLDDELNTF